MPQKINSNTTTRKHMLNLNDLITCGYFGGWPNGGRHRTIFGIGELNGICQSLFRNATPLHDMVNMELDKFPRMFINPLTGHIDVICTNVLTLFEQYRNYVSRGTGRHRYKQHLERRRCR